ncbi:hypothetical protein [Rhodococcus sp. 077-4]|uniref:hypothetical protein n=1 Tax=Rhodococcus sp. 077-4 TaxID=2789271 RepID=UPI0039F5DE35
MSTFAVPHSGFTSHDRARALVALAMTAVTWWLAWSVPIAEWALPDSTVADDRVAATTDVLEQGWWVVIVINFALTIGSVITVCLDYARGRRWSVTATRTAVRLISALAVMWAVWTTCVFAASGVQPS